MLNKVNLIKPWGMDKSLVNIINTYDAQIIGEKGDSYLIEFIDYDGGIVKDELEKYKFKVLPHKVKIGTHFFITEYKFKDNPNISYVIVWPVVKYWHPSWKEWL